MNNIKMVIAAIDIPSIEGKAAILGCGHVGYAPYVYTKEGDIEDEYPVMQYCRVCGGEGDNFHVTQSNSIQS